jgi:hypothetical protein
VQRLSLWSPQFFLCLVGWFKKVADSIVATVLLQKKGPKAISTRFSICFTHSFSPLVLFKMFTRIKKLRNTRIRITLMSGPDLECCGAIVAVADRNGSSLRGARH